MRHQMSQPIWVLLQIWPSRPTYPLLLQRMCPKATRAVPKLAVCAVTISNAIQGFASKLRPVSSARNCAATFAVTASSAPKLRHPVVIWSAFACPRTRACASLAKPTAIATTCWAARIRVACHTKTGQIQRLAIFAAASASATATAARATVANKSPAWAA